jgi:glycosyltransferase involved in cell wall biosynthesis
MRVGIDYTAAIRQGAGIGRYVRGLIGALAELDHETDYLLLSAGRQPAGSTWPANFRRRELPLSDRHLAIIWQRLRLPLPVEWLTGRLDLYHSPDFVLPPVRRAKTILTIHDLSFMRYPECSSPPLLDYLMSTVPRSVQRADLLLADSESTRLDLIELLGVPAERVRVVYAGIEERFVAQPSAVVAEALGRYGLDGPYILGLGTLQPRKNYSRLIEAYHMVRQEHGIPHKLVIVGGKGWLYEGILATIERLGLGEQVRLIGYAQDADLPALYTGASAFAFPSLYEGFGIPVLEAMACGTPVVTANTSSLPEVAGDAALTVDPEDTEALAGALWQVLSDARLRQALVEGGRRQVAKFGWDASARRLLGLYRMVAGEGEAL